MRPRFFYDLPSVFAGQIQQAESEADRMFEPVIGIVVDNKDPSKLGRVKVKFPILAAQETTWWAPIIMAGAGKNRGWFFIPEPDDEVLVLFEHGDIERPMIVGSLWNGKDKPPDTNPGGNPRRMIKSRKGSTFTFDDEKKSITIADGGGIGKIVIDASANKITIEAMTGDVALQSPTGEMSIACQKAEIEGTSGIEMVAGQKMEWGCSANVTLKAGGSMSVSGAKANANGGGSAAPGQPSNSTADVPDPVG